MAGRTIAADRCLGGWLGSLWPAQPLVVLSVAPITKAATKADGETATEKEKPSTSKRRTGDKPPQKKKPTISLIGSWRSWLGKQGPGLAVSSLVHGILLLILSFCIWRQPVWDNDTEIKALFEQPGASSVEIEIVGPPGEGGLPQLVGLPSQAYATVELVELGNRFDPQIPPLDVSQLSSGPKGGGRGGTGGGTGTGTRTPVGKNAVVEGSFTVWTEPADPSPGQTYTIIIEVKLPEGVRRYPRADLQGLVTGTDGWVQQLPGNYSPSERFIPIEDRTVRVHVEVPGAGRLVQDTVKVRSRILKEEQVLKIVF